MGFFNKIFGGKKSKSQEIETNQDSKEIKTEETIPEEKTKTSSTLPDEEARVEISGEIPVVSSEITSSKPKEKSTVFGMPSPLIPVSTDEDEEEKNKQNSDEEPQTTEEQNPELRQTSGTIETGTIETGTIEQPDPQENDLTEKIETEIPKEEESDPQSASSSETQEESHNIEQDTPEEITLDKEKSLDATIICSSCGKQLPVPYIGYPAKITCPFCLTVNNYNQD